ncbi:MAG: pitrilysin family protein [Pirellulaceae bacterium]|nr:pitrilysin family protein [Pirellulaceae bacterium]
MQFRQQTLANGLEIVAEVSPQAYSSSYAFFVRTGARDETAEVAGVSHFLEHMVFKGSAKRSAAEVNRDLDDLSSSSNAFTSEEQTVYYATTLPEDQGRIVELLADMMRPVLRQDDFDTEKKVILEEIAKYDDQPPYGADEKCMAAYFGEHPLGKSVLGTAHSVGALARDQMLGYFEERYSPRNMVLSAAGNVDFDALVRQAEQYCGGWKAFDAARKLLPATGRQEFQIIHKPQATQQYVLQIAGGPACEDDDRYAARLLGAILGDDTGSRLFWELIDTGLAEYASLSAREFQGAGIFMTYLSCAPEAAADNLARVAEIIAEVEADGVTTEELERAKNKICSSMVLQAERPANRMFAVGNGWIQRRQYKTIREGVEAYRRVTAADIAALLEKYPLSRPTTVTVGPLQSLPTR